MPASAKQQQHQQPGAKRVKNRQASIIYGEYEPCFLCMMASWPSAALWLQASPAGAGAPGLCQPHYKEAIRPQHPHIN